MNLRRRHLLMLLPLALAGCAGPLGQLKGAPLRVELDNLAIGDDDLRLSLLLFNPNDHSVLIDRMRFELVIDDRAPLPHELGLQLDIAPRNRERVVVRLDPRPDLVDALSALDRDMLPRLTYRLEGELQLRERRNSGFRLDDFLHRVPGQPGRFR